MGRCLFPVQVARRNALSYNTQLSRGALGFRTRKLVDCMGEEYKELDGFHKRFEFDSSDPVQSVSGYLCDVVTVPCGKCVECLKNRRNDFALRVYREAQKYGSMSFVTLTYDNTSYPIAMRLIVTDRETGEISSVETARCIERNPKSVGDLSRFKVDLIRQKINDQKAGRSPRYVYFDAPFFDIDEQGRFDYKFQFTPSLCARDVQLWLKRARVRYEREYKVKLPNFSYACCGEYGPNTCRPHYHILFMGLPKLAVDRLAYDWQQTFGFTYVEHVKCVNDDGSDGFLRAARYVGKYVSKGSFECYSNRQKDTKSMRLLCSKHLGTELPSHLVSYFRCYDLYGEYDINTLELSKGGKLSSEHLKVLYNEVLKRSKFTFGEFTYQLPNVIKKKLWYEKTASGSFTASAVRKAFSAFAQVDFVQDLARKFSQNCSDFDSREFLSLVTEYESTKASNSAIAEHCGKVAYQKSLFSSIF